MNEPEKPKKGWGWMQWTVVVLIIVCLIPLLMNVIYQAVIDLTFRNEMVLKGRSIIFSLKLFANDNKSRFPDAWGDVTTSNQMFRPLIRDEYAEERMFGGNISPYVEDGFIGEAPDFNKALEPGENHWVALGGLSTHVHPTHPVIYENALDSTWPPKWKSGSANHPLRGRVWRGNRILVGLVDGSISIVKTRQVGSTLALPEAILLDRHGKPWDDIKVLDIEEKK